MRGAWWHVAPARALCVCVEAGLVGPLMSGCMIEYSHYCRSQPGSVREREVAGA